MDNFLKVYGFVLVTVSVVCVHTEAFSLLRKTPVDSTTYLAPALSQGISAGFMLECKTQQVVREEIIPDVQNINMGDVVGQRYKTISPQN